jgi:hypothetical protein
MVVYNTRLLALLIVVKDVWFLSFDCGTWITNIQNVTVRNNYLDHCILCMPAALSIIN